MDPTVQIVIEDFTERQRLSASAQERIWHPLEQIKGYIIVRSSVPLLLDEVVLDFQGIYPYGPASIAPVEPDDLVQEHPIS